MALLTAAHVSAATGLALGDDTDGVCEKALEQERGALREASVALGGTVSAALATSDYASADPDSAGTALVNGLTEAERGALYAEYRLAVAAIAFCRIAPTLGPLRATEKGGFQAYVGEGDRKSGLLSVRATMDMIAHKKQEALSDLARIATAIGDASTTDAVTAPPVVWVT